MFTRGARRRGNPPNVHPENASREPSAGCSPDVHMAAAGRRSFIRGTAGRSNLSGVLRGNVWRVRAASRPAAQRRPSPRTVTDRADCERRPGPRSPGGHLAEWAARLGRRARSGGRARSRRTPGGMGSAVGPEGPIGRTGTVPADTWRNGQRGWAGGPDREGGHGPAQGRKGQPPSRGSRAGPEAAARSRAGAGTDWADERRKDGTVPRTDPRRGSPSGRTGTVARRGGTGSAVGPPPAWS